MTVEQLQNLLDKVPPNSVIRGVNFSPEEGGEEGEYSCAIYLEGGNETYRLKFWYVFKKFFADTTISAS